MTDRVAAARISVTAQQYSERETQRLEADDLIPPEVWHSGCWLRERLLAVKCGAAVAERIGFAVGQKQAHQTTIEGVWNEAVTAFERYTESGTWDEPGEALALQLLRENFGDPPDPIQILEWLRSRPTGRRTLIEFADEIRNTGNIPPLPKIPFEP